jgi:hypothetical protein
MGSIIGPRRAAFACLLLLACVAPGVAAEIPIAVTTAAAQDALQLGITETLTQNVANVAGIGWVNEIDVRVTSVGGTYLNGADPIPPTAGIGGIAGTWTFVGGVAYLAAVEASPNLDWTTNGAGDSAQEPPEIGGSANAPYSEVDFDLIGPAPTLGATWGGSTPSVNWWEAASLTGGWCTTWQNCNVTAIDATPGGTWGVSGSPPVPTGYGFDNTLLAAFYVSHSTTSVTFGTTDGGPFGNNNYGQFTLDYGGGRTDYVSFGPAEPGDANLDGRVDINDLTIVLANFGQTGCAWSQGCMDGDPTGTVDVNDLTLVLSNFGYGTTAGAGPAATPEPCALVLLLAALACLLARRPRLRSGAASQTSRSASGTCRARGA